MVAKTIRKIGKASASGVGVAEIRPTSQIPPRAARCTQTPRRRPATSRLARSFRRYGERRREAKNGRRRGESQLIHLPLRTAREIRKRADLGAKSGESRENAKYRAVFEVVSDRGYGAKIFESASSERGSAGAYLHYTSSRATTLSLRNLPCRRP